MGFIDLPRTRDDIALDGDDDTHDSTFMAYMSACGRLMQIRDGCRPLREASGRAQFTKLTIQSDY
ncbi:hypothetical protein BVU76_02975 [Mycolicibacterium porcinum]|nr:hypothetical protein BVU76_02975 [Mycolicibacterium porcinum]